MMFMSARALTCTVTVARPPSRNTRTRTPPPRRIPAPGHGGARVGAGRPSGQLHAHVHACVHGACARDSLVIMMRSCEKGGHCSCSRACHRHVRCRCTCTGTDVYVRLTGSSAFRLTALHRRRPGKDARSPPHANLRDCSRGWFFGVAPRL